MYLIDTNVISEYRKGARADGGVLQFFADVQSTVLFLPVQVVGEIQAGIAKLRRVGTEQARQQAQAYEDWLESLLAEYVNRVLTFDLEAARMWGSLLSNDKKDPHTIDKQIAAIALVNNLTVVTRDKGEAFSRMPAVQVLDPFSA
jgi:predicted nucleic acid-binding protein